MIVNVKVNKVDGRQELAEEAFFPGFGEADAFGIAGVGECFLGGNQAFFQKIGQRGIESDHSVLAADFHQANEVLHLAAGVLLRRGGGEFSAALQDGACGRRDGSKGLHVSFHFLTSAYHRN